MHNERAEDDFDLTAALAELNEDFDLTAALAELEDGFDLTAALAELEKTGPSNTVDWEALKSAGTSTSAKQGLTPAASVPMSSGNSTTTKAVTIRIPSALLGELKRQAARHGTRYQTYMIQLLWACAATRKN
jgi:predicted DNA binding CopG/RHH family protein